jgi:3-oxoadipate CoA-transferase beta subunit
LPLTAPGVVSRVYTDLAVLEVDRDAGCFVALEMVAGLTMAELQQHTSGPVRAGPGATAGSA